MSTTDKSIAYTVISAAVGLGMIYLAFRFASSGWKAGAKTA